MRDHPVSSSGIRTPDQRLRVFVSSAVRELAEERLAARETIERLHLTPVMFELGARPHPPQELYRSYLEQSDIFVGIYGDSYGWVAPDMDVSGLEDEYLLSEGKPALLYVRDPAPHRDERLDGLLRRIKDGARVSYKRFSSPDQLSDLLADDLAVLLAERFASREVELPSGTITMLFTDLEGSTQLLRELGERYQSVLADHQRLLRDAWHAKGGHEVDGHGDSFFVVFQGAKDALAAAVRAQRALASHSSRTAVELRVRMGLHTGEPALAGERYVGLDVHRAARIAAAGHGGQVLLSEATHSVLAGDEVTGVTVRDLGRHRIKDFDEPQRLYQLVIEGALSEFPPLRTLDAETNLPSMPTPLVGREKELETIGARLRRPDLRLLTLTGAGGAGKTRLAVQAGSELLGEFEDGVFFVGLASILESDLVSSAIAEAFGVRESGSIPLVESVKGYLGNKRLLLLLDNFEQVAQAAPLVSELLAAAPGLKILVTSRTVLHLAAEHEYPVPPLARPDAVMLCVQRAQTVKPGFSPSGADAAAIAEICDRLDGLPLAIELAAARVKLLSPQALLGRLGQRLQLLTGGPADLPTRHQTLRGTIDWSYELLDDEEKALFRRLSVFVGGCTLRSAHAVTSPAGDLGPDVLDGLASLVDKSLLRQEEGTDGEPRFRMLETIREYALERLAESGETEVTTRRHAEFFCALAEEAEPELRSPRQTSWLARLDAENDNTTLAATAAEIDNLRLAWRYWVDKGDLDQLNKLVDSLWLLYETQGSYHATIELTTELLKVLSSTPSTPERAMQEVTLRTSLARALMAIHGYTREVEEAYSRALELFEGERELPQLFPVLRGLASFYNYRAEFDKGAQVGREILRLADTQADPSMRVDGHLVLGSSLALQHDLHGGLDHLEQAIASFESQGPGSRRFRLGNNPGIASFTTSALTLWMLGFPDRALEHATRAVTLARELEHPFTLAYALFHAGFLHLWRREPEPMRDRAVEVLDVADEHDLPIWMALGTSLLGAAKTGLGRSEEGLAEIRDGIALYQGLTTPPVFWPLILYVRAGACARSGRAAEGIGLIDEAIEIADTGSGLTLLPEFYSLKGDLALLLPEPNGSGAEPWFQQAFDVARDLDARMIQLRAAIGLCRSQRERSNAQHTGEQLSAVYAKFTEGFTTPDLIDARDLLERAPQDDRRGRRARS